MGETRILISAGECYVARDASHAPQRAHEYNDVARDAHLCAPACTVQPQVKRGRENKREEAQSDAAHEPHRQRKVGHCDGQGATEKHHACAHRRALAG